MEFIANVNQNQTARYVGDPVPVLDTDRSSLQQAVYLQHEIKLTRAVIINAGLRYDRYEQFQRVTPRAALIVLPSSTQSFKYLYGSAFRAPNENELNAVYFGDQVSLLRPESIDTHELVWERYVNGRVRTSASAYWYKADRLITNTLDDSTLLGVFVRQPGSGACEGPRVRSPDASQGRSTDAGELRRSGRRGSADGPRAPQFAAARRQGTHQPAGADVPVVRVDRGPVSQQPHHAGRPTGVRRGDPERPCRPAARTLTGSCSAVRKTSSAIEYFDPVSGQHKQDAIEQNGRTARIGLSWKLWQP